MTLWPTQAVSVSQDLSTDINHSRDQNTESGQRKQNENIICPRQNSNNNRNGSKATDDSVIYRREGL